jgi:ribonuclease P protein component
MLPRENRLTSGDEIREVVKRGKRISTQDLTLHLIQTEGPSKFAFVVGKTTGNAVIRNLVKRRLREISREIVKANPSGNQCVVRAKDNAGSVSYVNLKTQLQDAFQKAVQ